MDQQQQQQQKQPSRGRGRGRGRGSGSGSGRGRGAGHTRGRGNGARWNPSAFGANESVQVRSNPNNAHFRNKQQQEEAKPLQSQHYRQRMDGRGKSTTGRSSSRFPPYWSREDVDAGIAAGTVFRGAFRVNAHNRQNSYATCEGLSMDVFIEGRRNQNRAFDRDVVAVVLFDKSQWKKLDKIAAEAEIETEAETEEEPLSDLDTSLAEDDVDEEDIPITALAEAVAKVTLDDPYLQPAGRIVAIIEANHSELQIGVIKAPDDQLRECFSRPGPGEESAASDEPRALDGGPAPLPSNVRFAVFYPMDQKMPRVLIPVHQVPSGFTRNPEDWLERLCQIEIVNWRDTSFMPLGHFRKVIGEAGDIAAETQALLLQYHIDNSEFSDAALADLPIQEGESWTIPEDEIARRRDLRSDCIFTIDPATAKDLDDALSIRRLDNGNYEVGIHIADVSFFVQPGTELDRVARERSTSHYLTQFVIPMLPRVLCEDLCSLNPGVDRLAFSVILEMRPTGDIVEGSQWFGRTVIRSCVKLPYAFAQAVIEKEVKSDWQEGLDWIVEECYMHRQFAELPEERRTVRDLFYPMQVYPDTQSGFTVPDVVGKINMLAKLGKTLRKKRFDGGSMALNNVKLSFHLDNEGNPIEAYSYVTKQANNLVEEFMLVANRQVGERVVRTFPNATILRNHPPPNPRKLAEFGKLMTVLGFKLNAGSSKTFGTSMDAIQEVLGEKDADIFTCLQMLSVRAMQTARYFCTDNTDPEQWRHYALNFPVYLHFTSPIRRYPDLIAHRQLQAALTLEQQESGQSVDPDQLKADMAGMMKPAELSAACDIANEAKTASRRSQEQSGQVFLCVLMGKRPTIETAICVGVGERFLQIIVPRYGLDSKIYMADMNIIGSEFDKASETVHIYWPKNIGTAGPIVGEKVTTVSSAIDGDSAPKKSGRVRLSRKQLRQQDKEKKKAARAARRAENGAEDVSSDDSDDSDELEVLEMLSAPAAPVEPHIPGQGVPAAILERVKEKHGGYIHSPIGLLSRFSVVIRKRAKRVPIEIELVALHPNETDARNALGAVNPLPVEKSRGQAAANDFEERH